MKNKIIITTLLLSSFAHATNNNSIDQQLCLTEEDSLATLTKLKQNKFELNSQDIPTTAKQLMHCLAHPKGEVRDQIAFTGLSQWLRAKKIANPQMLQMFDALSKSLNKPDDKLGVVKPFAALTLAEVIRADRVQAYLSEQQRQQAVNTAVNYLNNVNDYRGFEAGIGWRHNVAHGADLALQLVLNPNVNAKQHQQLLAAIANQIQPAEHFYTHSEPKRLMMPVLYIWLKKDMSVEQWQAWLDKLLTPSTFDSWRQAHQSEQGLAVYHNTRQFLLELHKLVASNNHEHLQKLLPSIQGALKTIG